MSTKGRHRIARGGAGMPSRFRIALAARWLEAGGIVGHPTEGVYGLACDPLDGEAVARLVTLKGRPPAAGFILVADDRIRLAPFMGHLPRTAARRMAAAWPGPVTWVVPAAEGIPDWITGGRGTVAVRVTAHPVAAALCAAFGGAVVSTSANRHGRPPARDALTARRALGAGVDHYLPGQVGPLDGPTEIRDALTGRVLRPAPGGDPHAR